MKIGYFSSKIPYTGFPINNYDYGGSILATYYLASEIVKRGHDVKVFTTSNNVIDTVEKQNGLQIFRYGTNVRLMTSNLSLGLFYKPLTHSVDVAHVSFDIPPAPFSGLLYCMKKKVPLITTYHGDWDNRYGSIKRRVGVSLNNLFIDKLLSYSKVIISPSKTYIDSSPFLRKYKEKVSVVPNGIDSSIFNLKLTKAAIRKQLNLPLDKHIILYFGFLSPYKGPEVLLRAMPALIKKYDVLLLMVGKGILCEYLRRLSEELNIQKYVKFVGYVTETQKPLLFNAADVFCLPSTKVTECFPLTILEAMASGVPVVSSNIGGIPDMIRNGHNGLLVAPNNPDVLSDTISFLLSNESFSHSLSRSGKDFAQTFSWTSLACKTEKIYEKITN